MTTLDKQDIQVLIEALDAWVSKDSAGAIVGDLLMSLMGKDNDPAMKSYEEEKAKAGEAKLLRKERATLLAAKLIGMKDAAIAEQAMA